MKDKKQLTPILDGIIEILLEIRESLSPDNTAARDEIDKILLELGASPKEIV